MKTILDGIKKETRSFSERHLPENSHFEVEFQDGSRAHEHDFNWSSFSDEVIVKKMGQAKVVRLCKHPVKKVSITHVGQTITLDVPKGCRPYQAIVAESTFIPNRGTVNRVVGRIVGLVNDKGEVVEERSINGMTGEIFGYKA